MGHSAAYAQELGEGDSLSARANTCPPLAHPLPRRKGLSRVTIDLPATACAYARRLGMSPDRFLRALVNSHIERIAA